MSSEISRKRIVVVVGMHRSGTSAIARGLKALGVGLGERLMPPAADNNERGFWEDLDVNALDDELLAQLGHRWDSLGPIGRPELLAKGLAPLRARAAELLREKLAAVTVFGMKDPRISRLLPFWRTAFADVGAETGFVICARHPLSVARSLSKRDAMGAEKSHYLWLEHVVDCVRDTGGAPRIVVDYDLLMASPEEQLGRIARSLGLDFDQASPGFAEYVREFLADELRHSVFGPDDLRSLPDTPRQVVDTYRLLHRLARDEASLEKAEVTSFFAEIRGQLDELIPAFAYINRADVERRTLRDHVTHLEGEVAVRDGHIRNLQKAAAEREARGRELAQEIGRLTGLVANREGELSKARQALEERELRVTFLEREIEREFELNRLRLADALRQVSRDEDRISRLKASLMELQDLLSRREAEMRAREAVIAERQAEVERLDGILGQVGHRFVSRIGALLAPYPNLRSAIRAPLRALQSLAGKS